MFVGRAGAYLLTAAVLAAFSSACCCKTFRLTFHAEIKIADKLGEETGATGGDNKKKNKQPAAFPRFFFSGMTESKCRSLAGVEKSFLIDASGGLISADHFRLDMSAEKM